VYKDEKKKEEEMNLIGFAYSSKKRERTKHDVYVRRKIQAEEEKKHMMTQIRKKKHES
jgi:hypothetical protein